MNEVSEDLLEALEQIRNAPKVKQRGGKTYTQVQDRIEAFRKIFLFEYGIETKLLKDDGKAILVQAIITDHTGRTVGSGLAEEVRGSSPVNTTSPIENGETSAIGRALASLGLHGGEYASANELDKVDRMKQPAVTEKPEPPNITFKQPLSPDAVQAEEGKPPCLLRENGTLNWAGEQIEGMKKHQHTVMHQAWLKLNRDALDTLEEIEPEAFALIDQAYMARKTELLNGVN